MHPFERKLITEWRRLDLPMTDTTVIAAVSGGADSISLLRAVAELISIGKLNIRLVVAHVNHQLRGESSDADETFVRSVTADLRVECAVRRINVGAKGNLEQNARRARYEAIRDVAVGVDASVILTGHTMDDQVETFLMNLIRGSGIVGLTGMPSVRPFRVERDDERDSRSKLDGEQPDLPLPEMLLVRPMISWAKRAATEQYCRDHSIDYCRDPMNDDVAFKRVRIRRVLLPLLEDMNPNIVETLAATAERLSHLKFNESTADIPEMLSVAEIIGMPTAVATDTIRLWLRSRRGDLRRISSKHITAIDALARSTRSGRVAEIPGGRVIKSGGTLSYEQNEVEKGSAEN